LLEELREMNQRLEQSNADLEKEIAERKSLQAQLVESEKMLGVGQLAAGITHEIANPLTAVLGRVQLLLARTGKPEISEDVASSLRIIQSEAKRTMAILDNLYLYSSVHAGERRPCNVNGVLEKTLSLLRHDLADSDIELVLALSADLPDIELNEAQMMRAFTSIVRNAGQAMPDGGRLTVESRRDGGVIEISFHDTGVGIPQEIRGRIFEPFFTTREPGAGVGLGLSVTYSTVKEHGGSVTVASSVGKGTTLTIAFPPARGGESP
jgi:signal transduction histidine kinase